MHGRKNRYSQSARSHWLNKKSVSHTLTYATEYTGKYQCRVDKTLHPAANSACQHVTAFWKNNKHTNKLKQWACMWNWFKSQLNQQKPSECLRPGHSRIDLLQATLETCNFKAIQRENGTLYWKHYGMSQVLSIKGLRIKNMAKLSNRKSKTIRKGLTPSQYQVKALRIRGRKYLVVAIRNRPQNPMAQESLPNSERVLGNS